MNIAEQRTFETFLPRIKIKNKIGNVPPNSWKGIRTHRYWIDFVVEVFNIWHSADDNTTCIISLKTKKSTKKYLRLNISSSLDV